MTGGAMINGTHVMVYSHDAEADRAFLRDTLGFAGIDAGEGWLIFKLPPAEIAVHPTEGETKHQLYLMCDDIQKTLEDLATKGVEISGQVSDEGWGQLASIKLPSGSEIALYEPRHAIAHSQVIPVTFALRVGSTQ
jgi:catechol 2,3-dioxygenase-like lactoylglutathione lyase family enzyme